MIASHQAVFSEFPVKKTAHDLGEVGDFVVLGYSTRVTKICAMKARSKAAGTARLFRLKTDKGEFNLAEGHLVRLSTGEYVPVEQLKPGMSLHAAATYMRADGYTSVGLQDGRKGRDLLHRMVAELHGRSIRMLSVHHRDGNKGNNRPENLEVLTQAEHASYHGKQLAADGKHIFQSKSFSHGGESNGMASTSAFWKDAEKSTSYREKQGRILKSSGRASGMQLDAARQKRCNGAFRILNAGLSIDTFEAYYEGIKMVFGRAGHSKAHMLGAITNLFGSYAEFLDEVARRNHRVVAMQEMGIGEVYAITVDTSENEIGNFLIMPIEATSPVGSGILVAESPAQSD